MRIILGFGKYLYKDFSTGRGFEKGRNFENLLIDAVRVEYIYDESIMVLYTSDGYAAIVGNVFENMYKSILESFLKNNYSDGKLTYCPSVLCPVELLGYVKKFGNRKMLF